MLLPSAIEFSPAETEVLPIEIALDLLIFLYAASNLILALSYSVLPSSLFLIAPLVLSPKVFLAFSAVLTLDIKFLANSTR